MWRKISILKTTKEVWRTEWVHFLPFPAAIMGNKERISISESAWSIIFFQLRNNVDPDNENLYKYVYLFHFALGHTILRKDLETEAVKICG